MDDRTRRYVARLDAARRRPLALQLEDDIAVYRGMTPDERSQTVEAVCRAAWEILRARPDFEAALAYRDPLAPDFESKWRALMERRRRQRGDGRGRP